MSIGTDVAAARAAAGLSLEDVAEATRVRVAVLDRIEHDDFSFCGGDVYARGHLRAIAHALDVDAEQWVATYDSAHTPDLAPLDLVEQHEVREARRTPNWTSAMAAALAVVVGIAVWTTVTRGGDSPFDAPSIAAQGTSAPTGEASEPTVTVRPDQDAVAAVDEVTLTLTAAEGKSWVSVNDAAGDPLYQGTLDVGQRKSFRDDTKLSLVVGNGAAVALTVNGQDLGAPGGQGEVVRLSFGPGDPSAG